MLKEEQEERAAEDARIKAEQDAVRFMEDLFVSFCWAALNRYCQCSFRCRIYVNTETETRSRNQTN